MGNSMKISKWKFEQEMESLLNAARASSSKSTAEGYLKQAWSKSDGYYNIPDDLAREYKNKVEKLAKELEIDI